MRASRNVPLGLATSGVAASFAVVRADVSATLPGIAISISLVPPLCGVGLTLESGAPAESLGALLLFEANVAAILASGLVVLARPPLSRSRRSHC